MLQGMCTESARNLQRMDKLQEMCKERAWSLKTGFTHSNVRFSMDLHWFKSFWDFGEKSCTSVNFQLKKTYAYFMKQYYCIIFTFTYYWDQMQSMSTEFHFVWWCFQKKHLIWIFLHFDKYFCQNQMHTPKKYTTTSTHTHTQTHTHRVLRPKSSLLLGWGFKKVCLVMSSLAWTQPTFKPEEACREFPNCCGANSTFAC